MSGRLYVGVRAAAMARLATIETRARFLRALTAMLRRDAVAKQLAVAKVAARGARGGDGLRRCSQLEREHYESHDQLADAFSSLGVSGLSREELVAAIGIPGLADGLAAADASQAYMLSAWHLSNAELQADWASDDVARIGSSEAFDQALAALIDAERTLAIAERNESEAMLARRRAMLEMIQAQVNCRGIVCPADGSGPGDRQAGALPSSGSANAGVQATPADSRVPAPGRAVPA